MGAATDDAQPRLGMLRETYELGLELAGAGWPTPAEAFGHLFERGVAFVEKGGELAPIRGSAPAELLEALTRTRAELLAIDSGYTCTRYGVVQLRQEGEALEKTWLELADDHLALRGQIVASRREEERLKRELARLGAPTVPLPEHEELTAPQPSYARKRRAMHEDLLEGAELVEVELAMAGAVLEAGDRLAEASGWLAEWGQHARLAVFAQGLSLALREREASEVDPDDAASVESAREQAHLKLNQLERRHATLRLRLFELRHNNRVLTWRITALRVEAEGMRSRLQLFEADRSRLEGDLAAWLAALPPGRRPGERKRGWRALVARLLTPPGREQ